MVPQETEYSEYLLKYKPMDKQLKLKTLVSSSAFRIMRMEGGVYFGEMQQNKREGQGIFVS